MLNDLPTISFDEVFHVGTLNVADRQDWSYEGDGLSVSLNPDEWAEIARLYGDVWSFTRTDGSPVTFVSWRELTLRQKCRLIVWADRNGWIANLEIHRVAWRDEDCGQDVYTDFTDKAEAVAEHEFLIEEEIAATITIQREWRATDAFPMERVSGDVDPTDLILCLWVQENMPEIDGVWWDHSYNPEQLSCAAGVLVRDLSTYVSKAMTTADSAFCPA